MKNQVTKNEMKPNRPRYRLSGRIMWTVMLIWAILFIMIKLAFKLGSNPVINFLVMLVLFFGVLFFMRIMALWVHNRWHDTRPGLVKILASFFYRSRQ